MSKKVVVAMSGGVDSSVTAALLKKEGYEVTGITMQVWPAENSAEDAERFGGCCSIQAVEDARKVASTLGIPFYVLNFREIFKEKVISNFLSEYKSGCTPNPCIRCNQFIKFEALLQKARGLGADFIATGHYARIKRKSNHYLLLKGKDKHKDQSYVLYVMTQEQLKATLMPLGEYTKPQVRQLARKLGLRVADKPESQEICFIPDNNYRRFLRKQVPLAFQKGPIYDYQGKEVGAHYGILDYTIGQRRGLVSGAKKPQYVLEINGEDNSIVVGPEKLLYKKRFVASEPNFIPFDRLKKNIKAGTQVRYNMQPAASSLKPLDDNKIEITFASPQKAITPGQAAVFYDGDVVLGGATIEKPL